MLFKFKKLVECWQEHRLKVRASLIMNNRQFKLIGNLKNRVRMAIKRDNIAKFNNTFELIGCSPNFFKKWLEYQFDENMSWNNYGKYWDISHIIPFNSFDLHKREEQLKCFNWKNCRPLKKNKCQSFQMFLQEIKIYHYERHIQIAGNS
jgi:hypothetical protein